MPAAVFMLAVFVLSVKAETLAPRTFWFPQIHLELQSHHQTAHVHGGNGTEIPTHGHNHVLSAHQPHKGHAHQEPAHHQQQHVLPGHQHHVGGNAHRHPSQNQHHVHPGHQHHVGGNVHQHAHHVPAHHHQQHVLPGHQHHAGSNGHQHSHHVPAHHHHHVLPGHHHPVGSHEHQHNHPHSSGSSVTSVPASASGRPATVVVCRVVEVTNTPAVPAIAHTGGGSFVHHHVFGNISASLGAVVGKVAHPVVALLHNASVWLNRTIHSGHSHHAHQLVHHKLMALINRQTVHPGITETAVTKPLTASSLNLTIASTLAATWATSRGSDATATRASASRALSTVTSTTPSSAPETTLPFATATLGSPGAVSTDVSTPTPVPSRATQLTTLSGRSGQVFTTEISNTPLLATNVSTRVTTLIEPTYTTRIVTSTVAETTSATSGPLGSDVTPSVPTLNGTVTRRLTMPTGQPSVTIRPLSLIFSGVTLRPFQR